MVEGSQLSGFMGMVSSGPEGLTWFSFDILIFCRLLAQTREMSSVTFVFVSSFRSATSFSTMLSHLLTSSGLAEFTLSAILPKPPTTPHQTWLATLI